jgi:Kdo2-lipid IVA lauroyltransferase/acyltransferase
MRKIIYLFIYAFLWAFTLLPLQVLHFFSDITFFLLYHVFGYRKKIVFINLQHAFPEKNKKEIKKIAKDYYSHISDFIFESIKIIHLSNKTLKKRFQIKNPELIDELYKKNKDIALVSGHYGNWEWGFIFPEYFSYKFYVIYMPLKNKYADLFTKKQRSKCGLEMVPMKDIYRKILISKKKKEKTITWFLGDQRPPGKKAKYWTEFLNMETAFYLGTEKIARKIDAAVVFLHIDKIKRGHYQVEFIKLFDDTKDTATYEITNKHIRTLEQKIREKPAFWLWSHRRWRGKNRNIYV